MKIIINESKLDSVVKKYINSYYGDVEMNVDEDKYINFFSEKDIDNEGYRKRVAHRNTYGTLWVTYNFFSHMVDLFGTDVGMSVKRYFEDKFGIQIRQVNIEF